MEDYIRLAALQGCHPKDFATFRRFLTPQALRLLRQQAQIARLQQALGPHVAAARAGTDARKVLPGLGPHQPPQDKSPDELKLLHLWEELDATLVSYGTACFRTGVTAPPLSISCSFSPAASLHLLNATRVYYKHIQSSDILLHTFINEPVKPKASSVSTPSAASPPLTTATTNGSQTG